MKEADITITIQIRTPLSIIALTITIFSRRSTEAAGVGGQEKNEQR